jgi:hypothetical protein
MTPDDLMLHILAREFQTLSARRRQLDRDLTDDASRAHAYERWRGCVNEIISRRASTRANFQVKAKVVRAIIVDAADTGPVASAALSLADDILRATR